MKLNVIVILIVIITLFSFETTSEENTMALDFSFKEWIQYSTKERELLIKGWLNGYESWAQAYMLNAKPEHSKLEYSQLIIEYRKLSLCVIDNFGTSQGLINHIDEEYKNSNNRTDIFDIIAYRYITLLYYDCREKLGMGHGG